MSCYRDTSVMMHSGIAAGDEAAALARGEIGRSFRLLFRARSAGTGVAAMPVPWNDDASAQGNRVNRFPPPPDL